MGRRVLRHHVPLGFGSAVGLFVFMSLPLFDISLYPHPDIVSGTIPQQRPVSHSGRMMAHGSDHAATMGHGGDVTGARDHGGGDAAPTDHGGVALSRSVQQFTVATGYLALGLVATVLAVYKPRGMTPYGQHKQREP